MEGIDDNYIGVAIEYNGVPAVLEIIDRGPQRGMRYCVTTTTLDKEHVFTAKFETLEEAKGYVDDRRI